MEELIRSELAFTNGLIIILGISIIVMAYFIDKMRKDRVFITNSLGRIEDNYKAIYDELCVLSNHREAILFGRQLLKHNIEIFESKEGMCWKYKEKLYNTKELFEELYNPHY